MCSPTISNRGLSQIQGFPKPGHNPPNYSVELDTPAYPVYNSKNTQRVLKLKTYPSISLFNKLDAKMSEATDERVNRCYRFSSVLLIRGECRLYKCLLGTQPSKKCDGTKRERGNQKCTPPLSIVSLALSPNSTTEMNRPLTASIWAFSVLSRFISIPVISRPEPLSRTQDQKENL